MSLLTRLSHHWRAFSMSFAPSARPPQPEHNVPPCSAFEITALQPPTFEQRAFLLRKSCATSNITIHKYIQPLPRRNVAIPPVRFKGQPSFMCDPSKKLTNHSDPGCIGAVHIVQLAFTFTTTKAKSRKAVSKMQQDQFSTVYLQADGRH
jgi:hypothetical protein